MTNSTKPIIFFRADGNSQMGLGHIFRSLALADMLKNDFDCRFMVRMPLEALKPKINAIASLIELPHPENDNAEAEHIAEHYLTGAEIVVLDGYHFRTQYQASIKASGAKLVCIDDIYAYHFVADVIINHAGGLSSELYSKEPTSLCYIGLDYALLQAPFLEAAKQKDNSSKKDNSIFVCLGGADPKNDTVKVLQKVEELTPGASIFLVLGASYQHKEALNHFLETSVLKIKMLSNLSAQEMVFYMQQCSNAICPPSTISYEYLSAGGNLYLHTIADNQNSIFDYFTKTGLAFDFQKYPASPEAVKQSLDLQKQLFRGQSKQKLITIFSRLKREQELSYRLATSDDLMLYFNWANHPDTRANGFNPAPIPLEQHKEWFLKKIDDGENQLFVFEKDNVPLGQVRLSKSDAKTALISFSVDSNFTGKGYGLIILKMAIETALASGFCTRFDAYVKPENIPSLKVFERLNFYYNPDTTINNIPCKYFSLEK